MSLVSTTPDRNVFECRAGCGACCIAPSISSPIPGMPDGKPAGVPCVQLDEHYQCRLFGLPERPTVCRSFQAEYAICGSSRPEAIRILSALEAADLDQPG